MRGRRREDRVEGETWERYSWETAGVMEADGRAPSPALWLYALPPAISGNPFPFLAVHHSHTQIIPRIHRHCPHAPLLVDCARSPRAPRAATLPAPSPPRHNSSHTCNHAGTTASCVICDCQVHTSRANFAVHFRQPAGTDGNERRHISAAANQHLGLIAPGERKETLRGLNQSRQLIGMPTLTVHVQFPLSTGLVLLHKTSCTASAVIKVLSS